MKDTGRILREARESQNISLAAVSAVTKINIKVLEAIESAQMENLPSKTFLRGFVQTYANFLKLSPNDVLDNFHKEMGTTKYTPAVGPEGQPLAENGVAGTPEEQASNAVAAASKRDDDEGLAFANGGRSFTSKIVFAAIAALLVVGIYIVSEIVQKYQRESQLPDKTVEVQPAVNPLPDPSKDLESDATKTGNSPNKATEPKPDTKPADAKVAEKPIEKTEAKPLEAKVVAKPAETKPVEVKAPETKTENKAPEVKPAEVKAVDSKPVEAKSPETKPPEVKPAEVKNPDATAEQKPAPPPGIPQEIVIEALDSVKLDYRIDGGALQSVTLQPEEKRNFRAKREVKMDVSDGGAVSVNHNGKDKGVPGNLGQPMKLSFP